MKRSLSFQTIRLSFGMVLCLSVLVWTAHTTFNHAPAVFETLEDHLEMIADHGHSHGFEEDLFRVLHGHSHETADHDHNQAFIGATRGSDIVEGDRNSWHFRVHLTEANRQFRIDRPPRA